MIKRFKNQQQAINTAKLMIQNLLRQHNNNCFGFQLNNNIQYYITDSDDTVCIQRENDVMVSRIQFKTIQYDTIKIAKRISLRIKAAFAPSDKIYIYKNYQITEEQYIPF